MWWFHYEPKHQLSCFSNKHLILLKFMLPQVYLLGKDSLVRVLIHNSRDQVASFSRQFVESISSTSGYVVDVYAMYDHKTGQPDHM